MDARFQHLVSHLHTLGGRVVGEFLAEVGAAHDVHGDIMRRLEIYGRLEPATVAAVGADHFPPRPFLVVAGGRG